MPNIQKEILKCKHPNSRRAFALSKKINKKNKYEKQKLEQYVKQNYIGEKITWFRDNLPPDIPVCTLQLLQLLIERYLQRFDEELEQIKLKHSVGNRKNRQHASREDTITMTQKQERNEFNTCGFEVPDFLDTKNFIYIKKWSGELRYLQNIKLKRYSKKQLEQLALRDKSKGDQDKTKDDHDKKDVDDKNKIKMSNIASEERNSNDTLSTIEEESGNDEMDVDS